MAGTTGLEPATSDVTGRRSNQLSYVPAWDVFQCSTPAPAKPESASDVYKLAALLAPVREKIWESA